MHWVMWVFWSTVAAIIVGSYLVDILSEGKFNLKKQERSTNQHTAEADALREVGRYNNQSGSF